MGQSTTPRAPRFRVGNMKVIYDTGESYWIGPVLNLSESGLFIETHHELPLGTRVIMLPDVPEDQQLPFDVQAEVTRVDAYNPDEYLDRVPGIAFRMVDMTEEQIAQFRSFLGAHGVPVA